MVEAMAGRSGRAEGNPATRRCLQDTHQCAAQAHARRGSAAVPGRQRYLQCYNPRPCFDDATMDHPLLRRHWPQCLMLAALLALLLWGAFAPLRAPSREQLFEIPPGAHLQRLRGEQPASLPAAVTLTLGVADVLLLRNGDSVPQVLGPVSVMPGQEFRLPFEQAGDYAIDCSAQASGRLAVRVVAQPDPGWERLGWRAAKLVRELRWLPLEGPV
jgi:hypothetical protein